MKIHFEVPRPIPNTNPLQWVIDIFDESGGIISTRECRNIEKEYLAKNPAQGFDAWANKQLLDDKRILASIQKYYTPGIWRGEPNKYAVK
jgi:hypothetical protein